MAMLTSSSHGAVSAAPSQAEAPATASISSAMPMRGKNAGGGGPMNLIVKRPITTIAPQISVSDGNTLDRSPNREPSMAASQSTSATSVPYLTTIIG